jgi:hypothetical protein
MGSHNHLEPVRIEDLIRLATARPDTELIRRFLAESRSGESSLQPPERAWVEANLRSNASWQAAALRIEEEDELLKVRDNGTGIALHRQPPFRYASASWRVASSLAMGIVLIVVAVIGLPTLTSSNDFLSVSRYAAHLTASERTYGSGDKQFSDAVAILVANEDRHNNLFQTVDVSRVGNAAEVLLSRYSVSVDRVQRAEMSFRLAKAHLMLDDTESTRSWLKRCIAEDVEYYSERATLALEAL